MLTNKSEPILLKELIARVKKDLIEDKDQSASLFLIGKIELELSFTVERTLDGDIDFMVIQSGVNKTMSNVQTIKVTLEPLLTIDEMRSKVTPEQKKKAKAALTREYEARK